MAIKRFIPLGLAILLAWVALASMRTFGADQSATVSGDPPLAPPKRASSAIALTLDGTVLLVVNPDSDSLSIVAVGPPLVVHEVAVGDDPRTVTVDDAQAYAYVANRGSSTVSVIDLGARLAIAEIPTAARPYGVVVSPDGSTVYVAEQGADQVSWFDTATRARIGSVPTQDRPSGLALSSLGDHLYITHLYENVLSVLPLPNTVLFLPAAPRQANRLQEPLLLSHKSDYAHNAQISPFDPREISLFPTSNLLQSVVISPDGSRAYLPHTRSNSSNQALTVDSTVFPLVSLVDLAGETHLVGQQFDLATLDPPAVGLPMDAALLPDNSEIWVLNSASNDITVLDLATGLRAAHIEVGANPRGITIHPDGSAAYVNNTLDGTVTVIDTAAYTPTATITVTTIPLAPDLLTGKRIFHDSHDPRLALDQWMSCNSCHFDGEHDGQTWFRAASGPRNTPSLLGIAGTDPFRWSGEWDELADSEFAIRMDAFGTGLVPGDMNCSISPPDCTGFPPHSGISAELDALAAYVASLPIPLSPGHLHGEPLSPAAQRGQSLFLNPTVGCASCHPPPTFTDGMLHDVGTATPEEQIGPAFNPPTLLGLYDSPPYFHDGRAASLLELLTSASPGQIHDLTGVLNPDEIQDLVAFLLSLPFE